MTKKLTFILIISAVTSLQVFSQQTEADKQQQRMAIEERQIENERNKIQNQSNKESAEFLEKARGDVSANISRRNNLYKPLSRKEREEILKNLEPNSEDLAKYKSFLKQPKTGIFRLMPNYNCTEKLVVNVRKECEKSFYIGEYYSFVTGDYGDNSFFDLTYENGDLISNDFWLQSIMTSLGDVPLDSLTQTSTGLKYLFDFVPQEENKAVKKQFREILKGIEADGHKYSKSTKALLNNTYALRLIGYRLEDKIGFRFRRSSPTSLERKILSANGKISSANSWRGGADLILAFRVIRQDADGSLTILWKEMGKRKSPKITFEKNEPLSNFGIGK
jgi:hypothetical protein